MSINACSINHSTINAACGIYNILSSNISQYTIDITQGSNVALLNIGTFFGGPVHQILISSGTLNGPNGTLRFFADNGPSGNLYFGGIATNELGVYSGQIRIYGTINFITINFIINIIEQQISEIGGQQQHINPNTNIPLNIFKRQSEEENILTIESVESPIIQVSIEFMGNVYTETIEKNIVDDIAIVSVSYFNIKNSEISVNISDIQIKKV